MIRVLFISSILLLTLFARENPFFPSDGEKELPISSNENISKEPLKKITISLPNQARVLQKVTIEFKNLDGTIENKSIDVDNSIDWHLPIFISQGGEQAQKSIQSDKTRDKADTSEKIKTDQKENGYATISSIKNLSLATSGKSLKITTSDEMMRNFLMVAPHRIVLDFKTDKEIEIKNSAKEKNDECNIFKEIRMGNHDGYYRVVIELDGHYRYNLKKIAEGYLIDLK